jgi:mono/diheme cytochrome c family protein
MKKEKLNQLAAFIVVYTLSVGCGMIQRDLTPDGTTSDDTLTTSTPGASLQQATVAILSTNCASCHGSSSGQGNVSNITDPASLISQGLVVPGSPTTSPLYSAVSSGTMPLNGTVLSSSELQTIQSWILSLSPTPTSSPTSTPTASPSPSPSPSASTTAIVSFSKTIFPVIQADCFKCHNNVAGNPVINSYATISALVAPDSPANSTLYQKISTGTMKNYSPTELTQNIYTWILQGAKNN